MKLSTNAFLNFTFKIGKVLSTFLLVIVFLVVIGATLLLVDSMHSGLNVPKFSDAKQQSLVQSKSSETTETTETTDEDFDVTKEYYKLVDRVISNNKLNSEMKKPIRSFADALAENDESIEIALNGLDKYYKNAFIELKDQKTLDYMLPTITKAYSQYYYDEVLRDVRRNLDKDNLNDNLIIDTGLFNMYTNSYETAILNKNTTKAQKTTNRIVAGGVLTVSLLAFVLLLFLPVLLKIEENTRSSNPIVEEKKKEDDTKVCPNCGKKIKINAKKCRYCETWLEEKQGEE